MKEKKISPKTLAAVIVVAVVVIGIIIFCITEHGRYQGAVSTPPPTGGIGGPTSASGAPDATPTIDPMKPPAPGEEEPITGVDERHYINNVVLSSPTNDGGTFYLGVDLGPDLQDAIYLSPTTSYSSMDGVNIGYYMSASPNPPAPQYGDWVNPGSDPDQHDYYLETVFDVAKPATYVNNEEYGVLWTDNRMGTNRQGTEIYIRAVDLGSGDIMGTYKATITYNKNSDTYALTALENTDTLYTGYLTPTERTELLSWCYDVLHDGGLETATGAYYNIQDVDKDTVLAMSTVEYVGSRTYFPRIRELFGRIVSSYEFTENNKDLVAVNLYCGLGSHTLYFSPSAKPYSEWFDLSTSDPSAPSDPNYEDPTITSWWIDTPLTSKQLNLAGCDVFYPDQMDGEAQKFFR